METLKYVKPCKTYSANFMSSNSCHDTFLGRKLPFVTAWNCRSIYLDTFKPIRNTHQRAAGRSQALPTRNGSQRRPTCAMYMIYTNAILYLSTLLKLYAALQLQPPDNVQFPARCLDHSPPGSQAVPVKACEANREDGDGSKCTSIYTCHVCMYACMHA